MEKYAVEGVGGEKTEPRTRKEMGERGKRETGRSNEIKGRKNSETEGRSSWGNDVVKRDDGRETREIKKQRTIGKNGNDA